MYERKINFELDKNRYVEVFGEFDSNIILLEKELNITISVRDNNITLKGDEENVQDAIKVLNQMLTKKDVTKEFINYALENKKQHNNFWCWPSWYGQNIPCYDYGDQCFQK